MTTRSARWVVLAVAASSCVDLTQTQFFGCEPDAGCPDSKVCCNGMCVAECSNPTVDAGLFTADAATSDAGPTTSTDDAGLDDDGGLDAGEGHDAAVAAEDGGVQDAGTPVDSGAEVPDAGPDSGTTFDSGVADAGPKDGGALDGGRTDGGQDGGASANDAGTAQDAGVDAGKADAGFDAGSADAGPGDAGVSDAGLGDAGAFDAGSSGDAGVSFSLPSVIEAGACLAVVVTRGNAAAELTLPASTSSSRVTLFADNQCVTPTSTIVWPAGQQLATRYARGNSANSEVVSVTFGATSHSIVALPFVRRGRCNIPSGETSALCRRQRGRVLQGN